MSRFFIPKENDGTKNIVGGRSVSLAGCDGRVMCVTLHTRLAKEVCVNFREY